MAQELRPDRRCPICRSAMVLSARHVVLRKYDVAYYYCHQCGLVSTEEPHWLEEAYDRVIADSDTGLVTRNIGLAIRLAAVLGILFDPRARYADVGGGYGMLTRLMRDMGFDYYWSDPYCDNILARGFEAEPGTSFLAVSAFETMEHVHDPLTFISERMQAMRTRTFIFSTRLFEGAGPPPASWAYYSFATGQHVSLYQRRTLGFIARALGLRCYSSGLLHMFTDQEIPSLAFRVLASRAAVLTLPLLRTRLRSRTTSDSTLMLERAPDGAASVSDQ